MPKSTNKVIASWKTSKIKVVKYATGICVTLGRKRVKVRHLPKTWTLAKAITIFEESEGNSTGRPSNYKSVFATQAYKLCLLGSMDKDLADFFEVTETTINNWKKDYPEFFESIKKGKLLADSNVADRLYQRALGFEHPSEEIKVVEGEIKRVKIKKIYPPDATSAIFWLKNRQPKSWRDRHEYDHRSQGEIIHFGTFLMQNNVVDETGE